MIIAPKLSRGASPRLILADGLQNRGAAAGTHSGGPRQSDRCSHYHTIKTAATGPSIRRSKGKDTEPTVGAHAHAPSDPSDE